MATEAPKDVQATFKKERETKNAVLFQEDGSGFVGSLYIKKFTLQTLGDPDTIVVTIKAG